MNKMIKVCVIGSIVYGAMEFAYSFGKGQMLGILKAYNTSAEDCIDLLSSDKRKKARFISRVAKNTAEYKASKIES